MKGYIYIYTTEVLSSLLQRVLTQQVPEWSRFGVAVCPAIGPCNSLGPALRIAGVPREALFLAGKLSAADHYPLGALRAVQQPLGGQAERQGRLCGP